MAGGDYSGALTEPATAEGFSLVRGRESRFLKPLDKTISKKIFIRKLYYNFFMFIHVWYYKYFWC